MEIALAVVSIACVSFFVGYINVLKKLKETTETLAEIVLIYSQSESMGQNFTIGSKEDQDFHQENFIKFLSDSRDWAYKYIEDVQHTVSEFVEEVEPSIEYFNEFGILVDQYPLYKNMKTISDSFEKLKSVLPEDINDRR